MEEDIIVEEFLNHFYTYEELAIYLNMDEERVRCLLDSIKDKLGETIKKHNKHIERYNSTSEESIIISEENERIVSIANYIIENDASIRKTASYFRLGKSTVNDIINDILPNISIHLYKKVFDVLQSHKSLSSKHKIRIEQIEKEYELLEQGLTISEICTNLNCSRNQVQRDLANRTKDITNEMNVKAKKLLHYNQMKMNRR